MILVDVFGSGKQHDLIEDVANFAIDTLMPSVYNLEVEIEVGQHDSQGGCVFNGDVFELEIDSKIKGDDLITCVLHEMVHVWQHVSKKLIEKNGRSYWNGVDHTDTPYLDQPWEVQAYDMQETLLEKWNVHSS
tara:strand:+ start:1696 stop:2094 length:399 start_codon:yes stop_codon:yes gene_type:complete